MTETIPNPYGPEPIQVIAPVLSGPILAETRSVLNAIAGPPEAFNLGHPPTEPEFGSVTKTVVPEWLDYVRSVPMFIAEAYPAEVDIDRAYVLEWADDSNAYLVSLKRSWPSAGKDDYGRGHIVAPTDASEEFQWSDDPGAPYRVAARALVKEFDRERLLKDRVRSALDDVVQTQAISFNEAEKHANTARAKLVDVLREVGHGR